MNSTWRALAAISLVFMIWQPTTSKALGLRYWDRNGSTAGSGSSTPTGTWGTDANWSTNFAGTSPTESWAANHAVFAAGNDATGAYTVTVSGTQPVGDIHFDEGAVTVTGGTLALDGPTATPEVRLISAFQGVTAIINTPLADRNPNGVKRLTKYKQGTLILGGANTYTGDTRIEGGTLQLGGADRLPDTSVLVLTNGGTDGYVDTPATFHTGGFSETLGGLRVEGVDATIDFGSGSSALVFGDSDAQDWQGNSLSIVNYTPGVDSLRIGTDGTGFDTQLALIHFTDINNAPAIIDSNGFVSPNLPKFLTVARTDASTVSLSWTSVSGRTYKLEYKDALTDSVWTDMGDIFANENTVATDDFAASGAQRYYRLTLLP